MISETKKLNSAIKLNERYGTGPTGIGSEARKFPEKETTSYDGPDPVIGRVNDLEAIVDTIKEHAKRLSIIAMVGPVGVGKTCLARLVFNHLDSGSRFTRRIWVYVHKSCSRVDIKRIGRQVVSQGLLSGEERPNADNTMQEITTKVHEILKRERCLIVLDGLWGADDDRCALTETNVHKL
jgi:Cdc6-like AAA superfamily ATPase